MQQLKLAINPLKASSMRKFAGNRIKFVIDKMVIEYEDESLRDHYYDLIKEELKIRNKFTMMLNNIIQPNLEEMVTMAEILGVEIESLIKYE